MNPFGKIKNRRLRPLDPDPMFENANIEMVTDADGRVILTATSTESQKGFASIQFDSIERFADQTQFQPEFGYYMLRNFEFQRQPSLSDSIRFLVAGTENIDEVLLLELRSRFTPHEIKELMTHDGGYQDYPLLVSVALMAGWGHDDNWSVGVKTILTFLDEEQQKVSADREQEESFGLEDWRQNRNPFRPSLSSHEKSTILNTAERLRNQFGINQWGQIS